MSFAPRSNRREFLQGKAAADALAEAAAHLLPDGPLAEGAPEGYLVHLARRAMACSFEVFLNAGQYPHATSVAMSALDLVDQLEEQLSIYRPASEISRLNQRAAAAPISVEPRLFALLELATQIHRETQGAYDITAARLSEVWGFTRRQGQLPSDATIDAALEAVGSQYLTLEPKDLSVRFARTGLAVNLGSIGKGYAIDRAAEVLSGERIDDFLLHGGNSSVLARGSNGSLAPDRGWLVGVRNPLRPTRRLGHLRIYNRALATSGSGTQFFMHDGHRYGHILDPRSGWPAEGVLSASVLAPTAAQADALSTAFYVMGPDAARAYCAEHPGISAVMLCPAARGGGMTTHLIELEEGLWMPLADNDTG